ncbi:hypothetical protein PUN28_007557 [Cardiocondyla obscurior]|uniref:ABC transporter G family member 20 n=1 Tax=Cardiocondyla obscurior TaxID=286306 RepID=A0AAW2G906_9HYME
MKTRRQPFRSQVSTLDTRRRQAVCVRRAFKKYGSKSNPHVVLDGLNMTVPKGTIYGLLGASGCGKTTLLSCIVGRRRLNSGEIWVLGGRPGSKGSGVPGPRVGYMPQELALYGEFSIRETFIYFGWCAGMTTEQIDEKLNFLVKFLQLPSENRFVKNLSGGQQRRVSFAAAILAEPELLILDEPTVGVDPVLRQNIWDHLVQITKDGNRTIIITTHYIEETRIMLFIIGLPVAQIVLFCISIGKDPIGLKLAIVNNELNNSMQPCVPGIGCDQSLLSCRYLQQLQKKTLEFIPYDNEEDARYAVTKGWAWGAITFPSNYSEALMKRIDFGKDAKEWDVNAGEMKVVMDMSNQQIGQLLQKDLISAYQDFAREVTVACNYSAKLTSIPVNFNTPIYGPQDPNFTDFAAPGVILTIIFFLSIALTSGSMLMERNEGLLERSLVSGLTGTEILFSQVITQFMVVLGQTIMVLIVSFAIFKVTCEGDIGWIAVLNILTGLCGMCFGFVIAIICDNERSATYVAMGSFLPIVMLCGIIWPIEGMHPVLKYISFVLPLTKSTESMRSMLARGWSMSEPTVYYGFIGTLIWISIFMTLAILLIKFKKG